MFINLYLFLQSGPQLCSKVRIMNASHFDWLKLPANDHVLQFYPDDDVLIRYLREFIYSGLANNEPCIVIATKAHIEMLNNGLVSKGIDLKAVRDKGIYIMLDARQTLDKFMKDGLPDWNLFSNTIGSLLGESAGGRKAVRAYGEMVALLWEDKNPDAVLELEKFWNDMAKIYNFSLYCGYPARKFSGEHAEMALDIRKHHSIVT